MIKSICKGCPHENDSKMECAEDCERLDEAQEANLQESNLGTGHDSIRDSVRDPREAMRRSPIDWR